MTKGLLTIEEAAQYLNVSKVSLRRWTNDGRLHCVRIGSRRERRFRLEDLERFLSTDPRVARRRDHVPVAESLRHVSLYYRDLDEQWSLFRPYLLDHVRRDLPVAYIHDHDRRDGLRARLRDEGLDVEGLDEAGLLRLIPASEAYLRTGSFAAERMLDYWGSVILDWRSRGHTSGLVTGETNWVMSGAEGVAGFMDYERRLNELLAPHPDITVVCHYDLRCMDAELVFQSLCCHTHVQLTDRIAPGYYVAD